MNLFLKCLFKYFFYFISIATILIAGLVVYLLWFQAPFYFPKPTGQYAIGSKTYHWVDTSRKETLHSDPAHPNRELMVKVWYPINGIFSNKPTTPYAPDLVDYFKKNQKLVWLLGFNKPVYSYAQFYAPIIQDGATYPVIIFSHGFGGTHNSNTAHCEELASHGYIVAGISHTYNSLVVKFPDGRIAGMTEYVTQRENKNFLERRTIIDHEEMELWITDVSFVLDQLEQLNKNKESIFYHRLDVKNSGMFGQSFGGSTAAQICRRDTRIKAGANLDGSLFGSDYAKNFNKPFISILAEESVKIVEQPFTQEDRKRFKISPPNEKKQKEMVRARYLYACKKLAQSIGDDGYTFILKGAGHRDFTDLALFKHASPISQLLIKLAGPGDFESGTINGFLATNIVNDYLVNFFDKYLKEKQSELLDGKEKRYPEIEEAI